MEAELILIVLDRLQRRVLGVAVAGEAPRVERPGVPFGLSVDDDLRQQLAVAAATLATRGERYRPRLVAAFESPLTGERRMLGGERVGRVGIDNDFYWDAIVQAMADVLQGARGTAREAGADAGYSMAGKSGTSQVFSIAQEEQYNEEEIEERLRDHALFIAFAPVDEPQIAVAVVAENGSSGSQVAAPMARAIMDEYLGHGPAP